MPSFSIHSLKKRKEKETIVKKQNGGLLWLCAIPLLMSFSGCMRCMNYEVCDYENMTAFLFIQVHFHVMFVCSSLYCPLTYTFANPPTHRENEPVRHVSQTTGLPPCLPACCRTHFPHFNIPGADQMTHMHTHPFSVWFTLKFTRNSFDAFLST